MVNFDNLRVTTLQVTAPYLTLCKHRGDMVAKLIQYIESIDSNSVEQLEILEKYNEYAYKDQQLVNVLQGRVNEIT